LKKPKAGYKTIGFDVQDFKVNMVNEGKNYIGDVVNEDLESLVNAGNLSATTDYAKLAQADW
jgi:UDP-N-acetyl-D-glucosamine dehydrogenase